MGYHFDHSYRGIEPTWGDSGTALTAGQEVEEYDSGEDTDGVLSYVMLFAKSPKVGVKISLDGEELMNGNGRDSIEDIWDMYCQGSKWDFLDIPLFDPINEKYVLVVDLNEINKGLGIGGSFASRCIIKTKNNDGSNAQKAATLWFVKD
ncbi:hypothetical protein ACFLXE_00155 [Chloroflexota bacterium]